MNTIQPVSEKKKSKSFWNRFLHISRNKSRQNKEENENFRRQSIAYGSLHSTKQEISDSNSISDESENFTTINSSDLMNIHNNAGILFLNKDSLENCFMHKEDNKHVQFAPTPMNKYYRVDIKSAPCKNQNDENKENLRESHSVKSVRPILRLNKNQKLTHSALDNTQSKTESQLVNVTYIKGPEIHNVKTPCMTRTSTKVALVDRKNVSLSQLNVSRIFKYNSLPRNQRIGEENTVSPMIPEPSNQNRGETLLPIQNSYEFPEPVKTRHRQSVRDLNMHRQSCCGVSELSKMYEDRNVQHTQYNRSNQDSSQRYSLGGPLEHLSKQMSDSSCFTDDVQQKNMKRFLKLPQPTKGSGSVKSLDQPVQSKHKTIYHSDKNFNQMNRQQYHASTGHIPNKAINEVGLPTKIKKHNQECLNKQPEACSKSPQYIPLSETFSSNKIITKKKNNNKNACINQEQNESTKLDRMAICSGKSKESNHNNIPQENVGNSYKCTIQSSEQGKEQPVYISETRKEYLKSAIHTQKRKMLNKMCKYKSKLCEDGFSSMADDECSFNCSCQTCIRKFSHNYKRNGFKNFFSFNKDNKYFFTIEPDIKVGNEMDRLPENQTFVGTMARAQPHLSQKPSNKPPLKNTWYNCNDSLCQTPEHKKPANCEIIAEELERTPPKQLVDNIYENITQIINGATKKNFKSQDVKRIFSTPISSPMKIRVMTNSLTKPPRSLFTPKMGDNHETLDQSLKQLLAPVKETDCFNDSIVLLQEIFQKLSQECQELLQPNVSSSTSGYQTNDTLSQGTPTNKYINDLVKSLKSSELNEADFAIIIGGIAQNIFSETKAKRIPKPLKHYSSLPDLKKGSLVDNTTSTSNSLKDLSDLKIKDSDNCQQDRQKTDSALSADSVMSNRRLPDGWSQTPTTEDSKDSSTKLSNSNKTERDSSTCSENERQLLENAIRLGMGLLPTDQVKKTSGYSSSPTKVTKYKSRDVLSGKGKLKLKIYNNCGLVTIFVMKAAKLSWAIGRELNSYVKVTMVPDDLKRVHWRTKVQKANIEPAYNEKLSFELLPEDETKRLVFSVWHRDYTNQRSELIGCMSFSVRNIMDNSHIVDGWYRLLREKYGTQKHFAAHTRKNSCSLQHPIKA